MDNLIREINLVHDITDLRILREVVSDRIKVIDQEIYGEVLRIHPTEVVIFDVDINDWLCFKLTEVEEIRNEDNY